MPAMSELLSSSRRNDLALLLIRLGIGLSMLLFHGWGKLIGGPERWTSLGATMSRWGIDFLPVAWGFAAAFAESIGSLLLIVGIAFRPAAGMLAGTMLVAAAYHLSLPPDASGAGWSGASHALELFCVYLALLLAGPGSYALQLRRRRS